MMRKLLWALIIVIAIGGGAWFARRHEAKTVVANSPAITSAEEATVQNEPMPAMPVPSNSTSPPAATPAPAPAKPAPLPTFQRITYQPKAGESAAITRVSAFYDAYNQADTGALAAQFDLTMAVTAAISAATQPGVARPVSATIKEIDTGTDGFQTVILDEVRSDGKSYPRIIELEPANNGMLLTAYRATASGSETSGF